MSIANHIVICNLTDYVLPLIVYKPCSFVSIIRMNVVKNPDPSSLKDFDKIVRCWRPKFKLELITIVKLLLHKICDAL